MFCYSSLFLRILGTVEVMKGHKSFIWCRRFDAFTQATRYQLTAVIEFIKPVKDSSWPTVPHKCCSLRLEGFWPSREVGGGVQFYEQDVKYNFGVRQLSRLRRETSFLRTSSFCSSDEVFLFSCTSTICVSKENIKDQEIERPRYTNLFIKTQTVHPISM